MTIKNFEKWVKIWKELYEKVNGKPAPEIHTEGCWLYMHDSPRPIGPRTKIISMCNVLRKRVAKKG